MIEMINILDHWMLYAVHGPHAGIKLVGANNGLPNEYMFPNCEGHLFPWRLQMTTPKSS